MKMPLERMAHTNSLCSPSLFLFGSIPDGAAHTICLSYLAWKGGGRQGELTVALVGHYVCRLVCLLCLVAASLGLALIMAFSAAAISMNNCACFNRFLVSSRHRLDSFGHRFDSSSHWTLFVQIFNLLRSSLLCYL